MLYVNIEYHHGEHVLDDVDSVHRFVIGLLTPATLNMTSAQLRKRI